MKKKSVFKKGPIALVKDALGMVLFTLAMIVMIAIGLSQTEESNRAEGRRLLEESIRRAAVECYALEGYYPESITYIEYNYGLLIDRSKYSVHYSLFASNFFPDIAVYDLRGENL